MPSAAELQHRRTHNLLLISKLLNGRDNASPFTLIIDSLEQSGKPLISEFIRRAKIAQTKVIFIAFETLTKPYGVDVMIDGSRKSINTLLKDTTSQSSPQGPKTLLVIDSLSSLIHTNPNLPQFLFSLITPNTSLLACFHSDVPLPTASSPYAPSPLSLLTFLATTILTTHSLSNLLAEKTARERSLASPVFGLAEEVEGVIAGSGSNDERGIVIAMEYRRKSGRGVREWFWLPALTTQNTDSQPSRPKERISLLEDHPFFKSAASDFAEAAEMDTTFNLSLTEKQRRDREGVVLPYFDAQREDGVGEGGRILYDMGSEDDFDEEEDEI